MADNVGRAVAGAGVLGRGGLPRLWRERLPLRQLAGRRGSGTAQELVPGFSGPDKLLQRGQIVLPEQGYSAVVLRFCKVLKLEDAR